MRRVVYVTGSSYKRDENAMLTEHMRFVDGTSVKQEFWFDIRPVSIKETLEISIDAMVRAEVLQAYSRLKVPCVVEHAGLIFGEFLGEPEESHYPGGLTKPMWSALGDRFLDETRSRGRDAVARAVVAYCDGQVVRTFCGETLGTIANEARGDREFYWDTVFVPRAADGSRGVQTYAEIVADPNLGLRHKVVALSQSSKAMMKLLEWMRSAEAPFLWPGT